LKNTGIKKRRVHFWYKDYEASGIVWRQMSLQCQEFIRRFLQHVLPNGYHKIRHYGFLANGRCKKILPVIRERLQFDQDQIDVPDITYRPRCTNCLTGILKTLRSITRWGTIFGSLDAHRTQMIFDTS